MKGVCRSMFCQEGYVNNFTINSCVRDNTTIEYETTTLKCPDEMLIEFLLSNKLCLLIKGVNDTKNCSSEMIHRNYDLISSLRRVLSLKLGLNENRMENLTLVSSKNSQMLIKIL